MKGQSEIDILFFVLGIIVVAFFLSSTLSQSAIGSLALRGQSAAHNQGLLAILNQQADLSSNQPMKGRVLDLLAFEACNGCIGGYCQKLDERINKSLQLINGARKHYIFDVPGVTRVYDNISSVCLEGISLAQLTYEATACNKELNVTYGTWPAAQKVKEPPC